MQMIFRKTLFVAGAVILAVVLVQMTSGGAMAQGPGYTTTSVDDCGQNAGVGKNARGRATADPDGGWTPKGPLVDWWTAMPQTNYTPHYGCYPGNARTIHRYPAFHGYYYRKPYNYRSYSEYPWHADAAEPQPYPVFNTQKYPGYYEGHEVILEERVIEPTPAKSIKASAVSANRYL